MKAYVIYQITPAPWGDDYRYIEGFDKRKDAEHVLKALEAVNINFSVYEVVPRGDI